MSLKNGEWKVSERMKLWNSLGSRIFDQDLDTFKSLVVSVLTERDPSFELPVEDRYAASIHGKVLRHSPALRKGLAEGLATARLAHDRRPLRVVPRTLTHVLDSAQQTLTISFALPAGAYATAVLREVVQFVLAQAESLN